MKRKPVFSSATLMVTVLAIAVSLGLLACTNSPLGPSTPGTDATGYSVAVSFDGGGLAASRAIFADGAVSSVAILVYDANGAGIGSGTLAYRTSDWGGNIAVSATGSAEFEATVLNSTGSVLYVGRTTYVVPTLGGSVSIAAGAVTPTLRGGSIQGQAPALSTMVNTFAGTAGTQGVTPGTGTAALFRNPYGMTTDGTNLYVADFAGHNIRKMVLATQVVTTFAGDVSGIAAYTDADGIGAGFTSPTAITTDGTYLFVTDAGSNIRSILIGGAQPTAILAGSSTQSAGATDNAAGSAALFNLPRGITYFSGYLYVADTVNNKIRKVEVGGTQTVTSLTGAANNPGAAGSVDGTATGAQFDGPQGITTDGTYLYVADTVNNKIRRILMTDGFTDTIAGTGVAGRADNTTGTAATFSGPVGITTDGTYLYVSDTINNTIRRITLSGLFPVTTLAGDSTSGSARASAVTGDGLGTAARFAGPYGITTDGNNLYVADYAASFGYTIRKIQ